MAMSECVKKSNDITWLGKRQLMSSVRNCKHWLPMDNLALIINMGQTNDLNEVHMGTRFSQYYSLEDIAYQWHALLYEPSICKNAKESIKRLHPEQVEAVKRRALLSVQEQKILSKILSYEYPTLDIFQQLLVEHVEIFYCTRTAKCLQNFWLLLKQHKLLNDQTFDEQIDFYTAELDLMQQDLYAAAPDKTLITELEKDGHKRHKQIRLLEEEAKQWSVLIEPLGRSHIDKLFAKNTLAVLLGRRANFAVSAREISIGRNTDTVINTINLKDEGPCEKISRRQAILYLNDNNEFFLCNIGSRPLYINGVPLVKGTELRIGNNTIIEFDCLLLDFRINEFLVKALREVNT